MKSFKKLRESLEICKVCDHDPCICDDSHGFVSEDGGAVSTGPGNAVSTGAIAGSGGKGGEPGVNLKKKKLVVMAPTFTRKAPKM
jgi:hypothetical protein